MRPKPGELAHLRTRAQADRRAKIRDLRQGILALAGMVEPQALNLVLGAFDALGDNAEGWRFVQLDAVAMIEVDALLDRHSSRPHLAARVLKRAFVRLSSTSQEILGTRADLARECGVSAAHLSHALRDLERLRVVWREPGEDRRTSRLFLNPWLATKLARLERETAQAQAPKIADPDAAPPPAAPGGKPVLRLVAAGE